MFKDLINAWNRKDVAEMNVPRRTFADVILPEKTRKALEQALVQIRKHDLIYNEWGLGERHEEGVGLAFNFAGPPGTGKTICAEAIAHQIGRKLYRVKYSELESMWAGETSKNLVQVFREAKRQNAVLFFDEADSVASRRFTSMGLGYEREANQTVNVLLAELESFEGVVIFATNLASNFDPAFERRIRTHILFEMPGPDEREKIWQVQLHSRTPLNPDVDFRALAEKYEFSGGDIKNAVLKGAQLAAAEPGNDFEKSIQQKHFIEAAEQVIGSKKVMEQNIFDGTERNDPVTTALQSFQSGMTELDGRVNELALEYHAIRTDLGSLAEATNQNVEELHRGLQEIQGVMKELQGGILEVQGSVASYQKELQQVHQVHQDTQSRTNDLGQNLRAMGTRFMYGTVAAGLVGLAALAEALFNFVR